MSFLIFLPFFAVVILGAYLVVRYICLEPKPEENSRRGCWLGLVAAIVIIAISPFILLGPIGPSPGMARKSSSMQTCRVIALAMFSYATDHDDHYPNGKSSTEVFQKLLDGNYISNPTTFFVPLPGKVSPTDNKLKPENVGYDVTSGIDGNSPDGVPVVFLTGFRIEYRASGCAVSLVKPFPSTGLGLQLSRWFLSSSRNGSPTLFDGLPVGYKSNNAWFRNAWTSQRIQYTSEGFGIVPNVLPPDFDAHGQTYCQLTPDGPLK